MTLKHLNEFSPSSSRRTPGASREHKATLGELVRKHTDVAMKAPADITAKGDSESARVAASGGSAVTDTARSSGCGAR
jgi:hypothetical protein